MEKINLKKIAEEYLPKIQTKKIFIVTGTGNLKRVDKLDLLGEIDTYEVASDVFRALILSGFKKTHIFPLTNDNLPFTELLKCDLFFNLVDSVGPSFAARATEELKKSGIPYTGSDGEVLRITADKNQTKQAVEKAGVKIAPSQLFRDPKDKLDEKLKFPIILKPKRDDGSVGITNDSVVTDDEELKKRLTEMLPTFTGPIMGEQFIDGREFSATVLEIDGKPVVLPIAEVHFPDRGFHGKWKIYNFAAKWVPGSPETKCVYANAPAKNIKPEMQTQIEEEALKSFTGLGVHGYGRFDFRLDNATNELYFLEANANPSLEATNDTETPASYQAVGLTQIDFIVFILKAAFERFGKKI